MGYGVMFVKGVDSYVYQKGLCQGERSVAGGERQLWGETCGQHVSRKLIGW